MELELGLQEGGGVGVEAELLRMIRNSFFMCFSNLLSRFQSPIGIQSSHLSRLHHPGTMLGTFCPGVMTPIGKPGLKPVPNWDNMRVRS